MRDVWTGVSPQMAVCLPERTWFRWISRLHGDDNSDVLAQDVEVVAVVEDVLRHLRHESYNSFG
jgi:hypothetical protein